MTYWKMIVRLTLVNIKQKTGFPIREKKLQQEEAPLTRMIKLEMDAEAKSVRLLGSQNGKTLSHTS
eukprot:scaffold1228_cov119-Cylindrotheca_fusiformis.AAC.14